MILNNIKNFDTFISESFTDGKQIRELRLSDKEVRYVKGKFPNAIIKETVNNHNSSEKRWYIVNIMTSNTKNNKKTGESSYKI